MGLKIDLYAMLNKAYIQPIIIGWVKNKEYGNIRQYVELHRPIKQLNPRYKPETYKVIQ